MNKRIALWMGLAALPAALAAEPLWQVVVPNPEGDFMVDSRSIRREGAVVRFKSLRDYRKEQSTYDGKAYRSTLAVIEMDCKAQEAIVLEMTYYTDRMLKGTISLREEKFHLRQPIDENAPIRRYAQRLCKPA
ncbi:MAG: surface-adhesin E family protein [Limnohabitans sp.]|jgi:hypothetical protein